MQTQKNSLRVTVGLLLLGALSLGVLCPKTHAASVGAGGYTNSFGVQPSATDWSTFSITGAAGDVTTAAAADAAVQAVAAASINGGTLSDAGNPPAFNATPTWSSTGFYLQTRPTGNQASLLMCSLINNLGVDAVGVTVSYDLATSIPVVEEVDGHRAFYSLTGLAGSWTLINAFSTNAPGRLTATLNITWPNNGSLYILWSDDNGSGTPDSVFQIDNFSVIATAGSQVPVAITAQPQSQTVAELAPASFNLSLTGYLPPTVQWYTNNVAVSGATATTFNIGSSLLAYNGMQIKAIAQNLVSNVTYFATSTVVTLTVNADVVAPTVASAFSSGPSSVTVAFSEPVLLSTATNLANYVITNNAGALLSITNATLAGDQTNVTLQTAVQTLGAHYTLVVNGIRDISAAQNLIAANTLAGFDSADFAPAAIGSPSIPGSIINVPGGYQITAGGTGIGGTADQCTFAYQQKAGDFDFQIRVADLGPTDPFAEVAFMARESLNANSVFAAAVVAPVITGCFFESRATTGAASVRTGSFPANYPNAWLRLKRAGNLFTGYASADGVRWVQLGSITLTPTSVYLGFAVTSRKSIVSTVAQIRDYAVTSGGAQVVTSVAFDTEPLSAAARTTPMVISEIMFKPASTNARSLEFIELYNSNPFYEDISGYRLTGDVSYTFPSNTVLPGGTFIVVAKIKADVEAAYGITGVLQYGITNVTTNVVAGVTNLATNIVNSLNNVGGQIQLRSDFNAVLLTVDYSPDAPWPVAAAGAGHSAVLSRASYGQNVPRSWSASDVVGGSPGKHEPLQLKAGLRSVVINEILANTDLPLLDFVELYNYGTQPVDISGCFLSDSPSTNTFRVPTNTVLPPHGYISFDETQMGFSLKSGGETIFFRSPDGLRMLDALQYEPQESGISFGRYPDGSPEFYRLRSLTPGSTNAPILVDDIVINEIMYAPISEEKDDQYIELYNKGTNVINIGGWKFSQGVSFKFPANTILAPNAYFVVARNYSNLLAHYSNLNPTNTTGDFGGSLSRNGERVALAKPSFSYTTNGIHITTNTDYVVVEEVTYGTGGRWGNWANQGGSSLELIDPRSNHRLAYNWGDSDETAKAPWTYFETTGLLDTGSTQGGSAIDRLEIIMLGEGECLLDELDARYPGSGTNQFVNGGFESGTLAGWAAQGNHTNTTIESSGFVGTRSMHVRSEGNGDTGANRVRTATVAPLSLNQLFTIKGYVRWLRGWPEITVRVKGGHLEAYARMNLPTNLGTPGAPNSRARANTAPAIYSVMHSPALPQANEPVVVTAGAQDPDGVTNVVLFYRVDSASPPAFTTLAMKDDGTGGDAVAGDGIYSATIPGQAASTMIGFYVEATDATRLTNQFPVNAIVPAIDGQRHECLIRFGEPVPVAAFATYRLWMSRANVNAFINRPALSNQDVDGTMVVGPNRVIYNIFTHYSNSPYHQGQNATPESGGQHFDTHLPLDDKYLGTENFNKIHAPGNGAFDDPTNMREQTGFYIARKLGIPYLYRRFVAFYVNGVRKGGANALQEDTQRPGGELVAEFFPDEAIGHVYKIQPWFEFDDMNVTGAGSAGFDNKLWCTLTRNLSTNAHKIARYRQNWLTRSADKTANDYTNVIALIEAANVPTSNPVYWQNFTRLVDIDQWAHVFAEEHAVGNWDSFGNVNAQNMYGYKPDGGKWKLMIWDHNIILNNPNQGGSQSDLPDSSNIFNTQSGQDPQMAALNVYPPFRRAWWRAYKELVNGPMKIDWAHPMIDAKYAAFLASGVSPAQGPVDAIKTFINTARLNISNAMAAVDFNGFQVTTPTVSATSSNMLTISGNATFDVTDIRFNGVSWPVTWTTITAWTALVPVTNGASITVTAYNKNGVQVGNSSSVAVTYAAIQPPDPRGLIVINELMYNPSPLRPNSEYIELYNLHSNFTFNLSGWMLNGVKYTFPTGTYIPPRGFIVLAKDRVAFNMAYGAGIFVLDEYPGQLQGSGETLSLIRPAASTNEADLVVDRIRYEGNAPWTANANGTGSSLQLVDPNQENARVANWWADYSPVIYSAGGGTPAITNAGWRFVSGSGVAGPGFGGNQMRLVINLANGEINGSSVVLDDIAVVAGTNAGVGPNFVRNGDFETGPLLEVPALTNSWNVGTNYTNTLIVSDPVHAGGGALKVVCQTFGNAFPKVIWQNLSPAPLTNAMHTLSFWFNATNTATNLTVKILNGAGGTVITTNVQVTITPSNYIAPTILSPGTNSLSPGVANQVVTNLSLPPLWINEVQAENLTGITDSYGEHDPWIEIYNSTTNSVPLEGLYLSASSTNLTEWAFPPGASIGPTQFLVVFCDGQPLQTSNTEYHTAFRLTAASGSVVLSQTNPASLPALLLNPTNRLPVLDYVNYAGLHSDRSYGSFPDGQPFDRMEFFYVTPRGTNDGRSAPLQVFINEWMASNLGPFADPADGNFDDWFELFNPGTNTVDLAGYYLTDTLTNKFKYLITTNGPHTIGPGGFLLVWADNQTGQNTVGGVPRADLHVNFQLAKAGEAIGLFAADGAQVDAITFVNAQDNVSSGRYPDGSANGSPGFYAMTNSTPRLPNYLAVATNTPPVLDPIGDKALYLGQTLNFTATASDADLPAQILGFSLDVGAPPGAGLNPNSGAFTWTPTAVGVYPLTVRVTDSGSPTASDAETINVTVLAAPDFSHSARQGNNFELTWGTYPGKKYAVEYKDDLNTPLWTPLETNTAGGTTLSYTNTTGGPQRFYHLRVVE